MAERRPRAAAGVGLLLLSAAAWAAVHIDSVAGKLSLSAPPLASALIVCAHAPSEPCPHTAAAQCAAAWRARPHRPDHGDGVFEQGQLCHQRLFDQPLRRDPGRRGQRILDLGRHRRVLGMRDDLQRLLPADPARLQRDHPHLVLGRDLPCCGTVSQNSRKCRRGCATLRVLTPGRRPGASIGTGARPSNAGVGGPNPQPSRARQLGPTFVRPVSK